MYRLTVSRKLALTVKSEYPSCHSNARSCCAAAQTEVAFLSSRTKSERQCVGFSPISAWTGSWTPPTFNGTPSSPRTVPPRYS